MIKRLYFILIISISFFSCMNLVPIKKKTLINAYPTSHIFKLPVNSLKESILLSFTPEKQYNSSIYKNLIFIYDYEMYGKDNIKKYLVIFSTEISTDKICSKEFFSTSGTKNDIYLHSYGQFWNSPIYYAAGKPLEFRAQFRLRLIQLDSNNTKLIVEIENPRVIKGVGGFGPHGFISNEIEVESTTIEEYCLIWYIASQIGDTTLIPINLDKNVQ